MLGDARREPAGGLPGRARVRRRAGRAQPVRGVAASGTGERGAGTAAVHRIGTWLLSLYLIVVWLLLFTGSPTPFYVGVILLLLPIALRCADLAVKHALRPTDGEAAGDAVPSLTAVTVERGLRAALLIGGAYLIAWLLGLDFAAHHHARHPGDAASARRDPCRGNRARSPTSPGTSHAPGSTAGSPRPTPVARRRLTRRGAGRACARYCQSSETSCSWS